MKTIGVYPGRFQPAHRGHLGVYNRLKQISGDDTFVATSDKTPTPESPLNFGEKQQIWARHGVPITKIVKVKNTYAPVEITSNYIPDSTTLIFALGGKDAERFSIRKGRDPESNKDVWMKADGKTPSYMQPYKGNERDMKPLSKHGYVIVVDDIKIDGKPISGTTIREALSSPKYTPEQKKKFFQWAFGWYDPSLYQMMVSAFSDANKASSAPKVEKMPSMASMVKPKQQPAVNPKARTISKSNLQKVVAEMLRELVTPQGGPAPTDPTQNASMSSVDRAKAEAEAKKNAVGTKMQANRDMDALKTDKKWKEKSILKLRKDDIPNKQKEIDQLNKVISGTADLSATTS